MTRLSVLHRLLELPDNLSACEAEKLKDVLKRSTDVFALINSELGCTDVVCQCIIRLKRESGASNHGTQRIDTMDGQRDAR